MLSSVLLVGTEALMTMPEALTSLFFSPDELGSDDFTHLPSHHTYPASQKQGQQ